MKILKRWFVFGLIELTVCLIGMAYAPVLINSSVPILGLLVWLIVLLVLASSMGYVCIQLVTANRVRHLFIQRFPTYRHLNRIHFLGISEAKLLQGMETFDLANTDPDFQLLQLSPLDLLRRYQR